jgi:hypothetical protein
MTIRENNEKDNSNSPDFISKWLYDKQGKKVGVLVASKVEGGKKDFVGIGFSFWNKKDKYDPDKAFDIALQRVEKMIYQDIDRIYERLPVYKKVYLRNPKSKKSALKKEEILNNIGSGSDEKEKYMNMFYSEVTPFTAVLNFMTRCMKYYRNSGCSYPLWMEQVKKEHNLDEKTY